MVGTQCGCTRNPDACACMIVYHFCCYLYNQAQLPLRFFIYIFYDCHTATTARLFCSDSHSRRSSIMYDTERFRPNCICTDRDANLPWFVWVMPEQK